MNDKIPAIFDRRGNPENRRTGTLPTITLEEVALLQEADYQVRVYPRKKQVVVHGTHYYQLVTA